MLANALVCSDIPSNLSNYRNVTFYLDTPLIIQLLGFEGHAKQTAARELITLLKKLKGDIAIFSHTRHELENVLQSAASNLENHAARGEIVIEARRQRVTRSDLLLRIESLDDELSGAGVRMEATPRYIKRLQIDEAAFEQALGDEVSYNNPRARDHDINSVRCIYVIRGNIPAPTVEKSRAVFVTSNTGFARAAWDFGQQHETTRSVSSVITDFSLANIAWLKAPMGAPDIPTMQLLSISYAALKPSNELLDQLLYESDKLLTKGTITERDHQLLRSSPHVYPELMHLTLGRDSSLTAETVTEILERVYDDIRREGTVQLSVEQQAHEETQQALNAERARNNEIAKNLYWRTRGRASSLAWTLSGAVVVLLIIGLVFGWRLQPTSPIVALFVVGSLTVLTLLTLGNLVFGTTVKEIHTWVEIRSLTWLLRKEAKSIGIDLSEFNID